MIGSIQRILQAIGMTMTGSKRHTHFEADVEKDRGQKRTPARRRVRGESGPASAESGRLQHRDHERSEEPGHEPRRGELSPGQEP